MGAKTEGVEAHTTKGDNANNVETEVNNANQDRPKDVRGAGKTLKKRVQTQISAWSEPRASFGVLMEH